MSTVQTNQNAANNYYNYTGANYTQGSANTEVSDNSTYYSGSNDTVAMSNESSGKNSVDAKKKMEEQIKKDYTPGFLDGFTHYGRSKTDISAIKMKDDFLSTMKNGAGKDNPVADFAMDTAVDFLQDKIGVSVGLPAEIASMAGESMMGCIGNDNYLGALGNYKEWRKEHPNATKQEILGYVQGQMNQPFAPMACLSDSMNAGTLDMSDKDRKNYMASKDSMLSAMMEFSYKNMNTLYGDKW